MRKADIDKAYMKFESEAIFLERFFRECALLFGQHPSQDIYLTKQAELCFHKLYVAFEVYISSLFIGLVNIDPSKYQEWLQEGAMKEFSKKTPKWLLERITFKHEKHIKLDQVKELLDPKGKNITFSDIAEMKKKARDWLPEHLASRFESISRQDVKLLNASIAMRNFISHESHSSRVTMNSALRSVNQYGGNDGLAIGVKDVRIVGAYLKAKNGDDSRFKSYVGKLLGIVEKLKDGLK